MNYYGQNKVISRYRLGVTIDELNELLDKSKKMLEDAREGKFEAYNNEEIANLLWEINYIRNQHRIDKKLGWKVVDEKHLCPSCK